MAAKALLDANPRPSDAEIRAALKGNLCRCGTHHRILRAVRRAAEEMEAPNEPEPATPRASCRAA